MRHLGQAERVKRQGNGRESEGRGAVEGVRRGPREPQAAEVVRQEQREQNRKALAKVAQRFIFDPYLHIQSLVSLIHSRLSCRIASCRVRTRVRANATTIAVKKGCDRQTKMDRRHTATLIKRAMSGRARHPDTRWTDARWHTARRPMAPRACAARRL